MKIYKDGLPPMSARQALIEIEKYCMIMANVYKQSGSTESLTTIQNVYDAVRNLQRRVEKEEGKIEDTPSLKGMRSHCKSLSAN